MPLADENRLRQSLKIDRTAHDKGWETSVKLTIYDNGIVGVNSVPLNPNPSQGMAVADARMPDAMATIFAEFKRQVQQRPNQG
jgi:hypothetical protein